MSGASTHVVLLDEERRPAGSMPKGEAHTSTTPFHLALSCYLFDRRGRILITQRALNKATWPGVITNSVCGHPRLNEDLEHAARRIVGYEIGCDIVDFKAVLPDFSYRAVSDAGIVEWEYCPVVAATLTSHDVNLNREEVEGAVWLPWRSCVNLACSNDLEMSPWSRRQIAELDAVGPPQTWSDRSSDLPDFLRPR